MILSIWRTTCIRDMHMRCCWSTMYSHWSTMDCRWSTTSLRLSTALNCAYNQPECQYIELANEYGRWTAPIEYSSAEDNIHGELFCGERGIKL